MKKYLAVLALTLSALMTGCSLFEPEIKYIQTPCPQMQIWEVKPLDVNVSYEVFNENG